MQEMNGNVTGGWDIMTKMHRGFCLTAKEIFGNENKFSGGSRRTWCKSVVEHMSEYIGNMVVV